MEPIGSKKVIPKRNYYGAYRIQKGNPKKELLWSVWVGLSRSPSLAHVWALWLWRIRSLRFGEVTKPWPSHGGFRVLGFRV